jgi:hypothetical protein
VAAKLFYIHFWKIGSKTIINFNLFTFLKIFYKII